MEHFRDSPKVSMCCDTMSEEMVEPCLFLESITTCAVYLEMLPQRVAEVDSLISQQDGAPTHCMYCSGRTSSLSKDWQGSVDELAFTESLLNTHGLLPLCVQKAIVHSENVESQLHSNYGYVVSGCAMPGVG
jgi:hypothetical protein